MHCSNAAWRMLHQDSIDVLCSSLEQSSPRGIHRQKSCNQSNSKLKHSSPLIHWRLRIIVAKRRVDRMCTLKGSKLGACTHERQQNAMTYPVDDLLKKSYVSFGTSAAKAPVFSRDYHQLVACSQLRVPFDDWFRSTNKRGEINLLECLTRIALACPKRSNPTKLPRLQSRSSALGVHTRRILTLLPGARTSRSCCFYSKPPRCSLLCLFNSPSIVSINASKTALIFYT